MARTGCSRRRRQQVEVQPPTKQEPAADQQEAFRKTSAGRLEVAVESGARPGIRQRRPGHAAGDRHGERLSFLLLLVAFARSSCRTAGLMNLLSVRRLRDRRRLQEHGAELLGLRGPWPTTVGSAATMIAVTAARWTRCPAARGASGRAASGARLAVRQGDRSAAICLRVHGSSQRRPERSRAPVAAIAVDATSPPARWCCLARWSAPAGPSAGCRAPRGRVLRGRAAAPRRIASPG